MKKSLLLIMLVFILVSTDCAYAGWEDECPVSDEFEEIKIEDAVQFASETYKEFLKVYIEEPGYEKIDLEAEEIPNTELGAPFYIYNVDGEQQPAYVYFPVYSDGKIVIVEILEYNRGHWKYGFGPVAFVCGQAAVQILNDIKYGDEKCIVYSINNICYVENTKETKILARCAEEDGDVYSEEEQAYKKMNFEEREKLYQDSKEVWCRVDFYNQFDEDVNKQLTGGPLESTVSQDNTDKKNKNGAFLCAIGGIVFGAGILAGCMGVFAKKKRE